MKISVFFLKKRRYTHARTPSPLPLFVFVRFSMSPSPSPPLFSSTNVLFEWPQRMWTCSIKCLKCFECPSAQVPECQSPLSAQVPWVPEGLSALWVLEGFEYRSAQVPWVPKCPWSALWVPNFPLRAVRVKKVWNITRNGLASSFTEFLKTFQNIYFYITLTAFFNLGNKMFNFYHILLAFKGVSKLSLNTL